MHDSSKTSARPADLLNDPDILDSYGRDVSGIEGKPDWLLRPRDERDISEVVRWAGSEGVQVLPVGAQTSTTGASVAMDGVVVDLKSITSTPELDRERKIVRVNSGTNLLGLQNYLRQNGFELPPDPTSAPDCTLGGAVATNASGPSSFRYGSMASFVRGLRFVDGRGDVRELGISQVEKSAMGPVNLQDPTRFFVGSEGLFGILLDIELSVNPLPPVIFGMLVGFNSRLSLFEAVENLRARRERLPVRAVEWLDRHCCEMLREKPGRIAIPAGEGGALYIELDGEEKSVETAVEDLALTLEGCGGDMDCAQIFQSAADIRDFDELRHRVPDTMNHRGAERKRFAGGGKLSTDWSVPMRALDELLKWTEDALSGIGIDGCYTYGHIGNGHPHQNIICPNSEVRGEVLVVLKEQLQRVVSLGGVPTSEHGIGKLKRDLVRDFLPPGFRSAMLALKQEFDPKGIFARGNIL